MTKKNNTGKAGIGAIIKKLSAFYPGLSGQVQHLVKEDFFRGFPTE